MASQSPGYDITTATDRRFPSSVSAPWPRVPLLRITRSYPRDEPLVTVKASIP
jgi:hypothetical protein